MSVDKSGCRIFNQGQWGRAHQDAHTALDSGDAQSGYLKLERLLATSDGAGSDFLHLHFHLCVFELALGLDQDALWRFDRVLRPHAATTDLVATDAPAVLWRMKMSGMDLGAPAFEEVRLGALRRRDQARSPFLMLHDLLAFAGAEDVPALRLELDRHPVGSPLRGFARGCLALATDDYRVATDCFSELLLALGEIGGSHAQNGMFEQLAAWTRDVAPGSVHSGAWRLVPPRAA